MNLAKPYDQYEFLEFLREFLPDFEKDISPVNVSHNLKTISKASYLGRSDELDLDIYEVQAVGKAQKKVSQAIESFKILKQQGSFNALIAYQSSDDLNWRFALLQMTPDLTDEGKRTQRYSNPRRYSFLLGPTAKIKTPTKFLDTTKKIVDFAELESRFSVEVVNKDFYREIAKFFSRLTGGDRKFGSKTEHFESEMKLPSQDNPNKQKYQEFAVRLIGRIIFCWFLKQKKSINNLSLLPEEYLSSSAVIANSDYYHNVLEKVFFEVLNKPKNDRKSEVRNGFDTIPYLNGGLFDPHEDDYYNDQPFYTLSIPDKWFKEFFEILETYNFTIDENTLLDTDLSIDPEMLGRIFENLLAEINPETGESARKSTGSYYTPRPIVEYMVDQSLIQYLLTKTNIDEAKIKALVSIDLDDDQANPLSEDDKAKVIDALDKVKIIDPACGSGAFPIGILQKIVFILTQADPNGTLWFEKKLEGLDSVLSEDIKKKFEQQNFDYIRKTGVIKDSIYGVDIQPIAVEVSKLRCFLTLVVDEEIDDTEPENRGIKPLPNLEFKFVAANTLIGLPSIQQGNLFEDHDEINRLRTVRDRYFTSNGLKKEQLKTEFYKVKNQMSLSQVGKGGAGELTMALASWDPFTYKSSDWFDQEWMLGVKYFDIVIANPPYDVYEGHKKGEIEALNALAIYDKAKGGKLNAYKLFLAKSVGLQVRGGILCEIFQNSFLADKSAVNIRRYFLEKQKIISIDSFPERDDVNKRVFAGVKMSVCILLSKNEHTNEEDRFILNMWEDRNMKKGSSITFSRKEISSIDRINYTVPLANVSEIELIKKLAKLDKLDTIATCYQGEINLTTCRSFLRQNKGDNAILIKGAAIQKWHLADKMSQGDVLFLDKGLYLSRNHGEKSRHHLASRIIMQGITGVNEKWRLKATILDVNSFCAHSVNYLTISDNGIADKFLLALLNSNILNWYFKKFNTNSNVNSYEIHALPIPTPDIDLQKPIIELVDKITLCYRSGDEPQQIKNHESMINSLVYALYKLTPDEIKIIEESVK